MTQAQGLITGFTSAYVIAERAYDPGHCLGAVIQSGALPVIPPRARRRKPHAYDAHLYQERHLVECFIGKIKQCRRIFSRFDKLANRYLAFLHLVSTLIWLR